MGAAKNNRAAAIPSDEPARQRRARPWRLLTAGGGLLLASTFFMPAVDGCNRPIIPAREVYEVADQTFTGPTTVGLSLLQFLYYVCFQLYLLYIFAYAFGLAVAIRAMRSLRSLRIGSRPYLSAALLILTCLITLAILVLLIATDAWAASQWITNLITGLIACAVLVYTLRALWSFGPRAHLSVTFLGSIATSIWFGCWVVVGYYGVRLSMAGSVMMLIGTIGEARVLTRRTWFGTLWRLITCRLRDMPLPAGACPGCDYQLFGLRDTRCPECGREFTFDELGLTPEQLGFVGTNAVVVG